MSPERPTLAHISCRGTLGAHPLQSEGQKERTDVRHGKFKNKKAHSEECANVGDDLSSRAATRQVFSAQLSLTTVFGMGTGGTSML